MAKSSSGDGMAMVLGIFALVVGLATIAVLVSQKSNTSAVLQALGGAGSSLIGAAVSPIMG